jgi:hypothetical protein
MGTRAPERDQSTVPVLVDNTKPRRGLTLPFTFSEPLNISSRSDQQWMEIVGGGRAPFRFSIRIFLRELCFNFFLPFSYFYVKCCVSRSDVFLWNRQMVFFGFHQTLEQESMFPGQIPPPHTFRRRMSLFLADLLRMLQVLGLRTALLLGVSVVAFAQDTHNSNLSWISYSYYPEVTLTFVMSLITSVFICLKWSLFPCTFDNVLKRERVPYRILRNQQLLTQWSPSLSQTISGENCVLLFHLMEILSFSLAICQVSVKC